MMQSSFASLSLRTTDWRNDFNQLWPGLLMSWMEPSVGGWVENLARLR